MTSRLLMVSAALVFGAAASAVHAQNLVTNGNFATGDFSGWTASGNVDVASGELPTDEAHGAIFNSGDKTPNGNISQTIATIAGDSYQLSFEYNTFKGNQSAPDQDLKVYVGTSTGLSILNEDGPGESGTGTLFTYDFVGGASTSLSFVDNLNNNTISNDGALGNISLVDLTPAATAPDGASTVALLGGVLALVGLRRKR